MLETSFVGDSQSFEIIPARYTKKQDLGPINRARALYTKAIF
jgi:hypothetical protein